MRRHAPEVRQYMTHLPFEAEQCETAQQAGELMRQHGIHHVPVMSGSHLKGVVSQHALLEARIRLDDEFPQTPLEQICDAEVLTISPIDPVDEVAGQMLARRTDSAVVMDGGFVVGIFTTTDALRFIREYFGKPKGAGDGTESSTIK